MSVGLLCVKRKEQMLSAELLGSVPSCECRDAVESSSYFERFLPPSRNCGRLWFRTWGKVSPLARMSGLLVKHKPKNKHIREIGKRNHVRCARFCWPGCSYAQHTQYWDCIHCEKLAHLEDICQARPLSWVLIPRCVSFLKLRFFLYFAGPHFLSLCSLAPSCKDVKKGWRD